MFNGQRFDVKKITYTHPLAGNYRVTLRANRGYCRSFDTVLVRILPSPVARFRTDTLQGCSPLTVLFTNQA
jgi:PKD repeat protein